MDMIPIARSCKAKISPNWTSAGSSPRRGRRTGMNCANTEIATPADRMINGSSKGVVDASVKNWEVMPEYMVAVAARIVIA